MILAFGQQIACNCTAIDSIDSTRLCIKNIFPPRFISELQAAEMISGRNEDTTVGIGFFPNGGVVSNEIFFTPDKARFKERGIGVADIVSVCKLD